MEAELLRNTFGRSKKCYQPSLLRKHGLTATVSPLSIVLSGKVISCSLEYRPTHPPTHPSQSPITVLPRRMGHKSQPDCRWETRFLNQLRVHVRLPPWVVRIGHHAPVDCRPRQRVVLGNVWRWVSRDSRSGKMSGSFDVSSE